MSHLLPSSLPPFDRYLLGAMEKFVPASEREEWLLSWESELWHKHHLARRKQFVFPAPDITAGLIRDALWLWGDGWRRTFPGHRHALPGGAPHSFRARRGNRCGFE